MWRWTNFGLFYWLASSPLKHSRTTVRVCDAVQSRNNHRDSAQSFYTWNKRIRYVKQSAQGKWNLNETVSKQFRNCFVSVSFRCAEKQVKHIFSGNDDTATAQNYILINLSCKAEQLRKIHKSVLREIARSRLISPENVTGTLITRLYSARTKSIISPGI